MAQLILSVLYLAFLVVVIAGNWKVYQKAGQPGWACIVPIYNIIVLLRIVGKPWWWFFLFCIPGLDLIWIIWTYNMLSKSFGKDEGFTVGLVLLSFVFVPILGFGDARYIGPYGDQVAFKAAQHTDFDFDKPATA